MKVVVGIDGGGTSTRVLAEPLESSVENPARPLFRGQSGSANLLTTHPAALRTHLERATEGCPDVAVVCGCFAGLLLERHRVMAVGLLQEMFPNAEVYAEPDYAAALFASVPLAHLAVVAGTGSIVCSYSGQGFRKSGGGGYLLGDVGSGFYFGRWVVSQFVAGKIDLTERLEAAVEEQFGTVDPSEVVARIYSEPNAPRRLARFAEPLGLDAESGVPWAAMAVKDGMRGLAEVVLDHAENFLFPEGSFNMEHIPESEIRVALAGGLWKSAGVFQKMFEAQLRHLSELRGLNEVLFQIEALKRPPVTGAVALGRQKYALKHEIS